ncbi:MAG TPA: hypothetical protein PKD64_15070 [Pirellulaceae bacterium]|nr:hypothetical protein [Pirellulaceae bacterium]HMO93505.1 hypothetical protein [Pirellulaceae bacterium]HMP70410.1 hypothetical protein [Pirellulaceae bacterium]
MKTFLMGLVTTFVGLCVTNVYGQWPNATYSERLFEIEANARIMDRPGGEQGLPIVRDALTNSILFTSDQATDLQTSPGFDLRLLRHNHYGISWELEIAYNKWDELNPITSVNGIDSPFFPSIRDQIQALVPAANNIRFNSLNYGYESDYFSIELNAKRAVAPGFTLFIGPRFIYLEDLLNVTTTGTFNVGAVTVPFAQNVNITTENPLIGGQVGASLHVPLTRQLYVTSFIKAGGYGNTARSTVLISDNLTNNQPFFSHRRSEGSFVGEVGGKLHYDIFPGSLSLFAGYEAMWVDNIAIAPTQLLGSLTGSFANVELTGTPFIHGIVFGATFRR